MLPLALNVKAQKYELFGAPTNFIVLTDSTLLIYDPNNTDNEVCLVNLNYDIFSQSGNCIRKGRGPGEISTLAMRFFNNETEQKVYIWDGGNSTLNTYSYDLEFLRSLQRPEKDESRRARYRIPLGNGDEYLSTFKVGSFGYYYSSEEDSMFNLFINSDLIEPAKTNPFYLQGVYDVDWNTGSLVFVTEYSSLVLKIRNKNTECVTLGEPNLEFPENEVENGFSVPIMSTYTFSSVDVSVNNDKIFVLHSGKKPTRAKTLWYDIRNRLDEYANDLLESKTVLVYNLDDCSYIGNQELTQKAQRVKVFNNKVYSLVGNGEDSAILIEDVKF